MQWTAPDHKVRGAGTPGGDNGDPGVARPLQRLPGGVGDNGVDLHARDVMRAEPTGEQCRVVPSAGPDFSYFLSIVDVQRTQHDRDHGRHAG